MTDPQREQQHSFLSIRNAVFLGFALVAGFFLLTEHRAHVFGALPYLLLLACPLMHFFGHGHGGHGGHGNPAAPAQPDGVKSAGTSEDHSH